MLNVTSSECNLIMPRWLRWLCWCWRCCHSQSNIAAIFIYDNRTVTICVDQSLSIEQQQYTNQPIDETGVALWSHVPFQALLQKTAQKWWAKTIEIHQHHIFAYSMSKSARVSCAPWRYKRWKTRLFEFFFYAWWRWRNSILLHFVCVYVFGLGGSVSGRHSCVFN